MRHRFGSITMSVCAPYIYRFYEPKEVDPRGHGGRLDTIHATYAVVAMMPPDPLAGKRHLCAALGMNTRGWPE